MGKKKEYKEAQSAIFEKTVFSGRCLRVAVWNLLQSFGNWRKYDFSGCAEYCYRALQRKSD